MMTKREKKKFCTCALGVILGIFVFPLLMLLVSGGKSSSVTVLAHDESVLGDGICEDYAHIRVEIPNDPTVHERLVAEFGRK
jgi:hypothetical protein